jgi:hypothetical protein
MLRVMRVLLALLVLVVPLTAAWSSSPPPQHRPCPRQLHVALPVRERRDAWYSKAQAQDVMGPFVLHVGVRHGHGLDDHSRVRATTRGCGQRGVVLIFAAPHPPQRAGMQDGRPSGPCQSLVSRLRCG